MKKITPIIIVFLCLTCNIQLTYAQVKMTREIEKQISAIVNLPIKAFELDLEENEKRFQNVDSYFSSYINLDHDTALLEKDSQSITIKNPVSKSKPVTFSANKTERNAVFSEAYTWYTKEPQKRIYTKELNIPAKTKLKDDELVSLSMGFILKNQFCKSSRTDSLVVSELLSRKRSQLGTSGTKLKTEVLFQRVMFKRKVLGMEVLNSKLIVDIYPDLKEVIAYKHIRWTPLKEDTGYSIPKINEKEVVDKIRDAKTAAYFEVSDVKAMYYQTETKLVPVLAVHMKSLRDTTNINPIEEILIITLSEEIDSKLPAKNERKPTKAFKSF